MNEVCSVFAQSIIWIWLHCSFFFICSEVLTRFIHVHCESFTGGFIWMCRHEKIHTYTWLCMWETLIKLKSYQTVPSSLVAWPHVSAPVQTKLRGELNWKLKMDFECWPRRGCTPLQNNKTEGEWNLEMLCEKDWFVIEFSCLWIPFLEIYFKSFGRMDG